MRTEAVIAMYPGEHRIQTLKTVIELGNKKGLDRSSEKIELEGLIKIAEEFKEKKWNRLVDERGRYYKRLFNKTKKGIFTKLFTLEFDGGNCPNCHKPWIEEIIDNPYLKGRYFLPNCDCFIQCPECESWLYDKQYEFSGKLKYCDNCSFKLIETETDKKKYGSEYFDWYKRQSRKRQIAIMRS